MRLRLRTNLDPVSQFSGSSAISGLEDWPGIHTAHSCPEAGQKGAHVMSLETEP